MHKYVNFKCNDQLHPRNVFEQNCIYRNYDSVYLKFLGYNLELNKSFNLPDKLFAVNRVLNDLQYYNDTVTRINLYCVG